MALMVTDTGGGDFKLVPQGTHIAVCFLVADIGMQETSYGLKHKVIVGWELPQETIEIDGEEKPMIIYQNYTASLSEKANLRQDLESWRGRAFTPQELAGFDLFNVLGHPCMVSVIHNESGQKTYANVQTVTSLPKGMNKPTATRTVKYSSEDTDQFSDLPEWIQKKINAQAEPQQKEAVAAGQDFDDSDIPF